MAASMVNLRSHIFQLQSHVLLQRGCVLCVKRNCATSPGATGTEKTEDLDVKAPVEPQYIPLWVPKQAMGLKGLRRKVIKKDDKKVVLGMPEKTQLTTGETINVNGVNVPKKKKRDSLSILKALSSTVKSDPSVLHYGFIDDPAYAPGGSAALTGVNMALKAKASGRRAAKYLVNEMKDSFKHEIASPNIPDYQPEDVSYKFTTVGLDALTERIERREVTDALDVYEKCKQEEITVPADLKVRLLELLCVFGGTNPPPENYPEEVLVGNKNNLPEPDLSQVEQLFSEIDEHNADTYNWRLHCIAKYSEASFQPYLKEMKKMKIPVYVETYNAVILSDGFLTEFEQNQNRLLEMFKEMKKNKVSPNQETFTNALKMCSRVHRDVDCRSVITKILAEMKTIGIKLNMEAIGYISKSVNFGRQGASDMTAMLDYIDTMDPQDVVIDSVQDDNALQVMMHYAFKYKNGALGHRVFKFREDMGDRYVITRLNYDINFFTNYFRLLLATEKAETVFDFFQKYVPYRVSMKIDVLSDLTNFLGTYNEYKYVGMVWDELKRLPYCNRTQLIQAMSYMKVPNEYHGEFTAILQDIFSQRRFKQFARLPNRAPDIANMYDSGIRLCLSFGDINTAWSLIDLFVECEPDNIDLMETQLYYVLKHTLEAGDKDRLMSLAKLQQGAKLMFSTPFQMLLQRDGKAVSALLTDLECSQISQDFGSNV